MKCHLKLVTLLDGSVFAKPSAPLKEYSVDFRHSHTGGPSWARVECVYVDSLKQVKGWVDAVTSIFTRERLARAAIEMIIETEDEELRMLFRAWDLPDFLARVIDHLGLDVMDKFYTLDDLSSIFERCEAPNLPYEVQGGDGQTQQN